jgi:ATP adenylyltransferase
MYQSDVQQQQQQQPKTATTEAHTCQDQQRDRHNVSFSSPTFLLRPKTNPFLPFDPRMQVFRVGSAHHLLLNKFSVVENHSLLITDTFEWQHDHMSLGDFAALACLFRHGLTFLAFYNCGKDSGASQPHRHIQFLPLPMPHGLPLDDAVQAHLCDCHCVGKTANGDGPLLHSLDVFQCRHAIHILNDSHWHGKGDMHPLEGDVQTCELPTRLTVSKQDVAVAEALHVAYRGLLEVCRVTVPAPGIPSQSYNWLMTREWMALFPRSKECYQSVSVNSLGFAGHLLAKTTQEYELICQQGPRTILADIGVCKE